MQSPKGALGLPLKSWPKMHSIAILGESLVFPPVTQIQPDGLLAVGGDISIERLLLAYRNGIFPWYEGDIAMWYCPDPRFVLFPENFVEDFKNAKKFQKNPAIRFSINTAFSQVIRACKMIERPGQDGTWIGDTIEARYIELHEKGYARSAELWEGDTLIGGLYGVQLGQIFFGESMFSAVSGASRYCFSLFVAHLKAEGIVLIDCQVHTPYLESMGAKFIDGAQFQATLKRFIP